MEEKIKKHNEDSLELCKNSLNETSHRNVFCMGTKPGTAPKFISFSFMEEQTIVQFLRMTAELIEKGELKITYIDLTESDVDHQTKQS